MARRYLQREGFRMLRINFRSAGAEVDIVAEEGGEVPVFCQVQYRRREEYGPPGLALTPRKQAEVRHRTSQTVPAGLLSQGQQVGSRVDLRHRRNAF